MMSKTMIFHLGIYVFKILIAVIFIGVGMNIWNAGIITPVSFGDYQWNLILTIATFGTLIVGLLFLIFGEVAGKNILDSLRNNNVY